MSLKALKASQAPQNTLLGLMGPSTIIQFNSIQYSLQSFTLVYSFGGGGLWDPLEALGPWGPTDDWLH